MDQAAGSPIDENFIEKTLDSIEEDRHRRGLRDLGNPFPGRFRRVREKNLDDSESSS